MLACDAVWNGVFGMVCLEWCVWNGVFGVVCLEWCVWNGVLLATGSATPSEGLTVMQTGALGLLGL